MKLTFSNFLAIASILTWASAWAATERNAVGGESITSRAAPSSTSVSVKTALPAGSQLVGQQPLR